MVDCPVCNEHVNYIYLRIDEPRCENKHLLGRWVMCDGEQKHVYISKSEDDTCPICGNKGKKAIEKGTKVKCMKRYPDGRICPSPEYSWLIDGPPCSMNHIDVIVVKE